VTNQTRGAKRARQKLGDLPLNPAEQANLGNKRDSCNQKRSSQDPNHAFPYPENGLSPTPVLEVAGGNDIQASNPRDRVTVVNILSTIWLVLMGHYFARVRNSSQIRTFIPEI
jgi:hypothetical protein